MRTPGCWYDFTNAPSLNAAPYGSCGSSIEPKLAEVPRVGRVGLDQEDAALGAADAHHVDVERDLAGPPVVGRREAAVAALAHDAEARGAARRGGDAVLAGALGERGEAELLSVRGEVGDDRRLGARVDDRDDLAGGERRARNVVRLVVLRGPEPGRRPAASAAAARVAVAHRDVDARVHARARVGRGGEGHREGTELARLGVGARDEAAREAAHPVKVARVRGAVVDAHERLAGELVEERIGRARRAAREEREEGQRCESEAREASRVHGASFSAERS
jgi:hypothetical protein